MNTKLSSLKESKASKERSANHLRIVSATARNLQAFTLDIPKQGVTLIEGSSGAGKSAILIDMLHKESTERLNTLFHDPVGRADEESRSSRAVVENLSPVIARRDADIYHSRVTLLAYLGLASPLAHLILNRGIRSCDRCGQEMQVAGAAVAEASGLMLNEGEIVRVYGRVFSPRVAEVIPHALRQGFSKALHGTLAVDLEGWEVAVSEAPLSIKIDSFTFRERNQGRSHLRQAVSQAALLTGLVVVVTERDELLFSDNAHCGKCGTEYPMQTAAGLMRELNKTDSDATTDTESYRLLSVDGRSVAMLLAVPLTKLAQDTTWGAILKSAFTTASQEKSLRFLFDALPFLTLQQDFQGLPYSQRSVLSLVALNLFERRGAIHIIDDIFEGLPESLLPKVVDLVTQLSGGSSTVVCATSRATPSEMKIARHRLPSPPIEVATGLPPAAGFPPPQAVPGLSAMISWASQKLPFSVAPGEMIAIPGFLELSKISLPEVLAPFLRASYGEVISPGSRTLQSISQYTSLIGYIAELYAKLPAARMKGFTADYFSLSPRSPGRCPQCQKGTEDGSPEYFLQKNVSCLECGGVGFRAEILPIRFKGVSFPELLHMPIHSAGNIFQNVPRCGRLLQLLSLLRLDHLTLRTPLQSLSHGELINIALVKTFDKPRSNILYLLDQPGLKCSKESLAGLLSVFSAELASGNSLIILENNPVLLDQCPRIISVN